MGQEVNQNKRCKLFDFGDVVLVKSEKLIQGRNVGVVVGLDDSRTSVAVRFFDDDILWSIGSEQIEEVLCHVHWSTYSEDGVKHEWRIVGDVMGASIPLAAREVVADLRARRGAADVFAQRERDGDQALFRLVERLRIVARAWEELQRELWDELKTEANRYLKYFQHTLSMAQVATLADYLKVLEAVPPEIFKDTGSTHNRALNSKEFEAVRSSSLKLLEEFSPIIRAAFARLGLETRWLDRLREAKS